MRKLIISSVALLALGATGASAAQKHREVVDRWTEEYSLAIDCAGFGPYTFENLVEGTQTVTATDVRDDEGELLETVYRSRLRETSVNSETGQSLRLSGTVNEVWDYGSNTRTLSGKVWKGSRPGEGALFQDTGRITMTLDTDEPLFVAGPHDVFFGDLDQLVCDALAG